MFGFERHADECHGSLETLLSVSLFIFVNAVAEAYSKDGVNA